MRRKLTKIIFAGQDITASATISSNPFNIPLGGLGALEWKAYTSASTSTTLRIRIYKSVDNVFVETDESPIDINVPVSTSDSQTGGTYSGISLYPGLHKITVENTGSADVNDLTLILTVSFK